MTNPYAQYEPREDRGERWNWLECSTFPAAWKVRIEPCYPTPDGKVPHYAVFGYTSEYYGIAETEKIALLLFPNGAVCCGEKE